MFSATLYMDLLYRFRFGHFQRYIHRPSTVTQAVRHLEVDLYITGNILFMDELQVLTTDGSMTSVVAGGSEGYIEGIGGEASFRQMRGFTQVNTSHVLVADSGNHCLRFINRITNKTSHYTGKCGTLGYRDGDDPLFDYPWGLTQHPTDSSKLYLSDHYNWAIRMIYLNNGICTTILARGGLNRPMSLKFDRKKKNLVIANTHFIVRMSIETGEYRVSVGISTGDRGHYDKSATTSYFHWPRDSIFISENVQLIIDHDNFRLRVLDLISDKIYSICTGAGTTKDGDITECGLFNPNALLYLDGYLYVGVDGISRMKS